METKMVKLTFCIKRLPHICFREFVKNISEKWIPQITTVPRIAQSVRQLITSYTSHVQRLGVPARKYDALIEFWVDDVDAAIAVLTDKQFEAVASNICKAIIDKNESVAVFTKELPPQIDHEISTKCGQKSKYRFTTMLMRNSNMSFNEFVCYHKEHHMPLFSSISIIQKNVLRYVVSHRINNVRPDGLTCGKYDGIVDFWFDNSIDLFAIFVNPKYLSKVRPDERRFLNLKACDFIISRELPPVIWINETRI
jgi:hypothetical protein